MHPEGAGFLSFLQVARDLQIAGKGEKELLLVAGGAVSVGGGGALLDSLGHSEVPGQLIDLRFEEVGYRLKVHPAVAVLDEEALSVFVLQVRACCEEQGTPSEFVEVGDLSRRAIKPD